MMKKLLATAAILSLVSVQAFAQTGAEAAVAVPVAPAPIAAATLAGVSVTTAVVAGAIVAAVAVAASGSNSTTTHH